MYDVQLAGWERGGVFDGLGGVERPGSEGGAGSGIPQHDTNSEGLLYALRLLGTHVVDFVPTCVATCRPSWSLHVPNRIAPDVVVANVASVARDDVARCLGLPTPPPALDIDVKLATVEHGPLQDLLTSALDLG